MAPSTRNSQRCTEPPGSLAVAESASAPGRQRPGGTPGLKPGEPIEQVVGHRVVGGAWGEGPPVYLVHGWGGWRGHLGGAAGQLLADAGYRVVAFDLPSHNESGTGWMKPGRTTIMERGARKQAGGAEQCPAHAIVAHSLGSHCGCLSPRPAACPSNGWYSAPMGDFDIGFRRTSARRHGFGPRIRIAFNAASNDSWGYRLEANPLYTATQIADPPALLVIHDPDDSAIHGASEKIVNRWPGATLLTTRRARPPGPLSPLPHRPAILAGVDFIAND